MRTEEQPLIFNRNMIHSVQAFKPSLLAVFSRPWQNTLSHNVARFCNWESLTFHHTFTDPAKYSNLFWMGCTVVWSFLACVFLSPALYALDMIIFLALIFTDWVYRLGFCCFASIWTDVISKHANVFCCCGKKYKHLQNLRKQNLPPPLWLVGYNEVVRYCSYFHWKGHIFKY